MDIEGAGRLLLLSFLLVNAGYDWKKKEILTWTVPLFGIAGICLWIAGKTTGPAEGIGGVLLGAAVIGIAVVTREAIGYGDGLALGVCGIYLGLCGTILLLFCALLFCSAVSLFLLVVKKRPGKETIPFLPYLFLSYGCLTVLGV